MTISASAGPSGHSFRRRATSLTLAVAANLLIIIALLTMDGPMLRRPEFRGSPITLDLRPDPAPIDAARPQKAQPKPRPRERSPAPPPPPLPPVKPPVIPREKPVPFLELSREEFAVADIAKLGTRGAAPGDAGQLASAAPDSERVGTAPNGEPLYGAEWYRRPTSAELSGYLPARMPKEGWGMIACRTVEGFRVEDCVELGNSPPGSRLAGAVRQAAWQFRVRPPRVGGKPLIGTWVRIRITYGASDAE